MNQKASINSLFNIVYLVFLIVWQPIKLLFIQIDGKGRIPFLLTLLVLVFNLAFNSEVRKLMVSKPFVIWLIWIVFAFINMMFQGYHYESNTPVFFLINHLFTPYLALVLTCYEGMRNRSQLLKVLLFSFAFYCILGFLFMGIRTNDDSSVTLGNALAINCSLLVFLLCVSRYEQTLSRYSYLLLMVFLLFVIITTATRKAFGASIILLAFYGLSIVALKPKKIILIMVLALGGYIGISYLMNNTYLGERFHATSEQAENREATASDSKFLQMVGDRAPHYVLGWELFKRNPVTGIGLLNFQYVTGFPERLHTEYMVQFTENGLVGFVLFVLYYLWFINKLFKLRKFSDGSGYGFLGLGWIAALLFLAITAWTYDMTSAFICSGIVASFVYSFNRSENVQ